MSAPPCFKYYYFSPPWLLSVCVVYVHCTVVNIRTNIVANILENFAKKNFQPGTAPLNMIFLVIKQILAHSELAIKNYFCGSLHCRGKFTFYLQHEYLNDDISSIHESLSLCKCFWTLLLPQHFFTHFCQHHSILRMTFRDSQQFPSVISFFLLLIRNFFSLNSKRQCHKKVGSF